MNEALTPKSVTAPHLNWIPKWDHLRSIGNSTAVRLTILIPLVGYLIIFNDELSSYFRLAKEFVGISTDESQSGIPRLALIYVGLCCPAVGATLYGLFCPNEVKLHATASEYVSKEAGTVSDTDAIIEILMGTPYKEKAERTYARLKPGQVDKYYDMDSWWKDSHRLVMAILRIYYDNNTSPVMRLACAVSFTIGFTALLIPSVSVFLRVVEILISGDNT